LPCVPHVTHLLRAAFTLGVGTIANTARRSACATFSGRWMRQVPRRFGARASASVKHAERFFISLGRKPCNADSSILTSRRRTLLLHCLRGNQLLGAWPPQRAGGEGRATASGSVRSRIDTQIIRSIKSMRWPSGSRRRGSSIGNRWRRDALDAIGSNAPARICTLRKCAPHRAANRRNDAGAAQLRWCGEIVRVSFAPASR